VCSVRSLGTPALPGRCFARAGSPQRVARPATGIVHAPPKWRKLIFANRKADRRLYETAVLATLRDRLKGSGIWVAGRGFLSAALLFSVTNSLVDRQVVAVYIRWDAVLEL
jgi:hypothetical protein